MPRRLATLAGLAGAAVAAVFAFRRGLGGRSERVDVYFDDGSLVSYASSSAEAQRLLPPARDALAVIRAS
ncbi:MAG TPA: hypothetical protein VLW49_00720 [Gaiellaceae bacterium]|nr:hypothetical protein [Gaiellaceae bacterium]